MFVFPAVTWILTVVLLLSGTFHLLQAARSEHLTQRVNEGLHALMSALMVVMLWGLMPSTMLAQIIVLAGAALWFLIQAVARPEFTKLCAGRQDRVKCVYHSLTMAGAAFMVAMMAYPTTARHEVLPVAVTAAPTSASHAQHAMVPAAHSTAGTGVSHSPDLAILLTVFFAVAAVVFIILLMRNRVTKNSLYNQPPSRHSVRAEHGHEALGATVMALMFATMTA